MPDEVTTPVVHIDEMPAVPPPVPVLPTAVTAFVGRTARGPVGEPRTVRSLAEFERVFGGLWLGGPLGHAVRDYFVNGGAEAVVVRVLGAAAGPARAALNLGGGVVLEAANEGAWGNALRARVEHPAGPDDATAVRFTLTVRDGGTGDVEVFPDVCLDPGDPRRLDAVLAASSALVRLRSGTGSPRPPASAPVAAGVEPWADPDPPTSVAVAAGDRADDGAGLTADDFVGPQQEDQGRGLYALRRADLFTLLNVPPYLSAAGTVPADPAAEPPEAVDAAVLATASALCRAHRAVLLVDPPPSWATADDAVHGVGALGVAGSHVAVYFPRLLQPDPLRGNAVRSVAPSGAVAGVVARTDSTRGVRHPPAGPGAALRGTAGLTTTLTADEVTALSAAGVNALQVLPRHGAVVRGAGTLDDTGSERAYLPVRRLLSTIGQSLERGLTWTVFEPSDEALWSTVRRTVEDYLQTLFRQGAFAGTTPDEAYFVRCDRTTTTQADLDAGRLVCLVGVAPLVPAEFVLLRVVQRTALP
ncbi:phage tail sheath C-terminal domain-containing protein [Kineosporia sp. A_224]|uniref:phage tail sheath family protein n=1 Tax=Kineosporia sp. A_224 TaxID=1962180 RepID=UPI000B4B3645|nr:phage tail sheath C-terminal domain-containing protein [Kineosporia sp. A_224]